MVFVNNKKYACATCIKGHRSSTCGHTDRPLFEIKRKGRPQTQCEHCRRLRKTRQVHVRCDCATLDDIPDGQRIRDGEVSMYPHGVADILNSVSVPAQYPTPARIENLLNPCDCNHGGACYCCTPRQTTTKRKRRRRRSASPESVSPVSAGGCCSADVDHDMLDTTMVAGTSSPDSACCGGTGTGSSAEEACGVNCSCRNGDGSCGKPCCRDSNTRLAGQPGHLAREDSVTGEAAMYAEMDFAQMVNGRSSSMRSSHTPTLSAGPSGSTPTHMQSTPTGSSIPGGSMVGHSPMTLSSLRMPGYANPPPPTTAQILAETASLTRCGCGWTCACAGCTEHNPGLATQSYEVCPDLCTTCVDCLIGSVGGGVGSVSGYPLNIPSPQPQESVSAFLARQALSYGLPPAPPSRAGATRLENYSGNTFVMPFNALTNSSAAHASGVTSIRKMCCGGQCACRDGECACADGCAGGVGEQGCADPAHNAYAAAQASASASAAGGCCSSKSSSGHPQHAESQQQQQQQQQPTMAMQQSQRQLTNADPWSAATQLGPAYGRRPSFPQAAQRQPHPNPHPHPHGQSQGHNSLFMPAQGQGGQAMMHGPSGPALTMQASSMAPPHSHSQSLQRHTHPHVPFGAFQQTLAAAGLGAAVPVPNVPVHVHMGTGLGWGA